MNRKNVHTLTRASDTLKIIMSANRIEMARKNTTDDTNLNIPEAQS